MYVSIPSNLKVDRAFRCTDISRVPSGHAISILSITYTNGICMEQKYVRNKTYIQSFPVLRAQRQGGRSQFIYFHEGRWDQYMAGLGEPSARAGLAARDS